MQNLQDNIQTGKAKTGEVISHNNNNFQVMGVSMGHYKLLDPKTGKTQLVNPNHCDIKK